MNDYEKFKKEISRRYNHARWTWNGVCFSYEGSILVGRTPTINVCYRFEQRHEQLTIRLWQREFDEVLLVDEQSNAFVGSDREERGESWLVNTLFSMRQQIDTKLANLHLQELHNTKEWINYVRNSKSTT